MKRRLIPPVGLRGPVLVPSFSSHGFLHVKGFFDAFAKSTTQSYLVSAYDIFHGLLQTDSVGAGDLVILDSGGYEAYASSELSTAAPWAPGSFETVLTAVGAGPTVLPVTFDYNKLGTSLADQLSQAEAMASAHDFPAWDFLVKPIGGNTVPPAADLASYLGRVAQLGALGFVEDELGGSLLERARLIRDVRGELSDQGLETPIHVFGCLNPLTIPYYVEAGADVFDGLEWLRGRLDGYGVQRFSDYLLLSGRIERLEEDEELRLMSQNLRQIRNLERDLRRYVETGAISELRLPADRAEALETFRRLLASR